MNAIMKEPINCNQLAYMAKQTCPDLVKLRIVTSSDGKWNIVEGLLSNGAKAQNHSFGRIVTARNATKNYATLDSVRTDFLRACSPYHPAFVLHLEEMP